MKGHCGSSVYKKTNNFGQFQPWKKYFTRLIFTSNTHC